MSDHPLPLYRHSAPHRELVRRYRVHFTDPKYLVAAATSVVAFVMSVAASLMAGSFSNTHASNSVSDLVLSNTPILNLDALFVYGTMLFVLLLVAIALTHPRRIPFMFYSLALFFFIRSGFVTLTHIAPFPEHATSDFGVTVQRYFFGSDLFFSGHTGTPFLMALLFWRDTGLRLVFLGWSVFFAVVVLLGHLHYSIDVASAYFITYTVYHMAAHLFPRYRDLFYTDVVQKRSHSSL